MRLWYLPNDPEKHALSDVEVGSIRIYWSVDRTVTDGTVKKERVSFSDSISCIAM